MTPDWPGDTAPLPRAVAEDRVGARLAGMVGTDAVTGMDERLELPAWLANYGEIVVARFLSHTIRDEAGCLIWTGHCVKGYGRFSHPGGKSGRLTMGAAHRFAYETFIGPIPDGFEIDHLCRVPRCVEPSHLEPVTPAENRRREWEARRKLVCLRGHEYTPENTQIKPDGRRECRACARLRDRERRRKPPTPEQRAAKVDWQRNHRRELRKERAS